LIVALALASATPTDADDVGPRRQPFPLPTSGAANPDLAAFDQVMQEFMRDRQISGGTLAVLKDGQIVLQRGYGYADARKHKLLGPETPLRIASVSKPITAAAVLKLIRAGKLRLDTKVFALLQVTPLPGKVMDKRLTDVTVGHLLTHQGGWDRETAGDPMFRWLQIAQELRKPGPVSAHDVVRYMAGEPLQFDPGSKSVYANFGYCVLGRVIEKASGKSYIRYVREDLLAPLGIKSIDLGRTLPKDRDPREPLYLDPALSRSVFDSAAQVPAPDGMFHLEAMDAHGGLIASAPDLVRFMHAYWLDGQPRRAEEKRQFVVFGSLPGTWAMALQRPDGVCIAALFNSRAGPPGKRNEEIADLLNKAAQGVKGWAKTGTR
jgi:N-acyl-D-amino-acid deacylase